MVAASGASFACLFSYTARLSALAAAIAVATSVVLAVHLVRRNQAFGTGAWLAAGAPLAWLIYVTWRFNEMLTSVFALLAAAVAIALLPAMPFERAGSRRWRWLLGRLILVGALTGLAVFLAHEAYEPYEPW